MKYAAFTSVPPVPPETRKRTRPQAGLDGNLPKSKRHMSLTGDLVQSSALIDSNTASLGGDLAQLDSSVIEMMV